MYKPKIRWLNNGADLLLTFESVALGLNYVKFVRETFGRFNHIDRIYMKTIGDSTFVRITF